MEYLPEEIDLTAERDFREPSPWRIKSNPGMKRISKYVDENPVGRNGRQSKYLYKNYVGITDHNTFSISLSSEWNSRITISNVEYNIPTITSSASRNATISSFSTNTLTYISDNTTTTISPNITVKQNDEPLLGYDDSHKLTHLYHGDKMSIQYEEHIPKVFPERLRSFHLDPSHFLHVIDIDKVRAPSFIEELLYALQSSDYPIRNELRYDELEILDNARRRLFDATLNGNFVLSTDFDDLVFHLNEDGELQTTL